ncbi:craniofacial development protein 2-like [Limulus polyphemus]|uniref:Craniofacial development protein 2-like n=1 Tax=Limulus polyphemus TaxID=6850 RepID=A0ABM1C473_LIMPO|nr:craniofacial development protein 2-like [Limulus polyphemus]
MDGSRTDRPEHRTALIAKELARYHLDIVALSETRLADKGQLSEVGTGYTFYWSGHNTDERREAGVGFAIRSDLASTLPHMPEGIDDHLMTLQLPLTNNKNMTLISAYAPTMTNQDETKDMFYEDLESVISSVPRYDKLVILGDFNARVGSDHVTWEGVVGKHGIGTCNSNGLLLLQTCTIHDLTITNTLFHLPTRNRTSWIHPLSKHWHLIDYVITRKNDVRDVRVTKAVCGAECWTDHRLIISRLVVRVVPRRRPQGQKMLRRLNVAWLKIPEVAEAFRKELEYTIRNAIADADADPEEWWTKLQEVLHATASQHLGPLKHKHQDWFDESDKKIQDLLTEKHQAFMVYQNDPASEALYHASCICLSSFCTFPLAFAKATFLDFGFPQLCYADQNDSKHFYESLKTVYGPKCVTLLPLFSSDGSWLLVNRKQVLDRWIEHFEGVLNRPSIINDEAIDRLP